MEGKEKHSGLALVPVILGMFMNNSDSERAAAAAATGWLEMGDAVLKVNPSAVPSMITHEIGFGARAKIGCNSVRVVAA